MAQRIFANQVLTPEGWRSDVTLTVGADGRIDAIRSGQDGADTQVDVLLPAPSNVHSHSFQRAMAGLAERRGPNAHDDFWTWRQVMYRFLQILTPEHIETIAAQMQMELLEAGYAAIGEFHYVHHQSSGMEYAQIDELSCRHISAAMTSGIGLTHLPVLYMQGGLDGRALDGGQLRFGNEIDRFETLYGAIKTSMGDAPDDFVLGIAPHSLRAVTRDGLNACIALAPDGPIHIHAAEQIGEVEDVLQTLGKRPVRWLLDSLPVDARWCLIHATQMDNGEVDDLAASGAVVGLCPITEANLGDGIFKADRYLGQGGTIAIGSDSNIKIALSEELRLLETSQRLRDQQRIVLSSAQSPSNGRYLYDQITCGGAQALARNSGSIEVGKLADLVALNGRDHRLIGLKGDTILDAWIFACDDTLVSDVWSAGRHVVNQGRHIRRKAIESAFTHTIEQLREQL